MTELGDGWRTERAPPPRPPPPRQPISRAFQKHQAASIRRQIQQKEVTSVVFQHRFVASKSLEHSRKWFQREVEAQLQRGGLFEDPFMPPVDSTIWPDRSNSSSKYRWCRPGVSFCLSLASYALCVLVILQIFFFSFKYLFYSLVFNFLIVFFP